MIDGLPELQEELDRKTLDAIGRLVTRLRNGEISRAQFDTAVAAIFETVSGLVGDSVQEVVDAALNEAAGEPDLSFYERDVLAGPRGIVVLSRHVNEPAFTYRRRGADGQTCSQTRDFDGERPGDRCREAMALVAERLIEQQGYERIA